MKARLVFTRNTTAQYSYSDITMEKETKTIIVDLDGIENREKFSRAGDWQIVGYEEIKEN